MASLSKTFIKALLSGGMNTPKGKRPKRKKYYHSVMFAAIPIGDGITGEAGLGNVSVLLSLS
jgi:hypothetical protein